MLHICVSGKNVETHDPFNLRYHLLAVGQNWIPQMEPGKMETWTQPAVHIPVVEF